MDTAATIAVGAPTVRDVMRTEVVSVSAEHSIRQLVQLLAREGVSGVPVLDAGGRVQGVVSATDVVRFAAQEGEVPAGQVRWASAVLPEEIEGDEGLSAYYLEPESRVGFTVSAAGGAGETALDAVTVREIMTPVAFSVRPSDSLESLVQMLLRGRIHRALVVEQGRLVGIVTLFDVLAAVFRSAA